MTARQTGTKCYCSIRSNDTDWWTKANYYGWTGVVWLSQQQPKFVRQELETKNQQSL
jgi:hypothetical protein